MKKNFKKFSNPTNKKSFTEFISAEKIDIEQINMEKKDERYILTGLIDQIEQTGGPTIFHLTDGTGDLALKAFDGAGVRAYPNLNVGDAITTNVTIQEYQGELEGEIDKITKLSSEEKRRY